MRLRPWTLLSHTGQKMVNIGTEDRKWDVRHCRYASFRQKHRGNWDGNFWYGFYQRGQPSLSALVLGIRIKSRVYIPLMTTKSRITILKTLRTLTAHYQDYMSPPKRDVLGLTFMRRIPSFGVNPWRPVAKNITGMERVAINDVVTSRKTNLTTQSNTSH